MKFDVIVGNPPYGVRTSYTHLKIFNTALEFCNDKLCFIMPSKPIVQQLPTKWYDIFKNAVCTDIIVVDKKMFPTTTMDNTAIYYCDRTISKENVESKYCKKLNVDDRVYSMIDDSGHKLFIDKMNDFTKKSGRVEVFIDWDRRKKETYPAMIKDDKSYLIVNRAHGSFGGQWISSELESIKIMDKNETIDFVINDIDVKNIIECPTPKWGEGLKQMLLNSKVLRYGLWLTQIAQGITTPQFKYLPKIDYDDLTGTTPRELDKSLLLKCNFSDEDAETVLTYLYDSNDGKGFDFKQSRNDVVRGSLM